MRDRANQKLPSSQFIDRACEDNGDRTLLQLKPVAKQEEEKVENNHFFYSGGIQEHIDCVFLSSGDYHYLFKEKRYKDVKRRRRFAVVKITCYIGGHLYSIHRRYEGNKALDDKRSIAMNFGSCNELLPVKVEDWLGKPVHISKGSYIKYYWNCPVHATRIGVRLGCLSLALGLLSIILCLIQMFSGCC